MYLETERLIINNLSLDDLQFLTDLDSDPLVRKFIDGKVKLLTKLHKLFPTIDC